MNKRPSAKNEAERWLLQAKKDLDDAAYLMKGSRFNTACFLAQQAAEKALKAFLYNADMELVWGHSVAELCHDASLIETSFEALKKEIAILDQYYIPTRYPNGLPGGVPYEAYDIEDAQKAIRLATKVIDHVKALLKTKE
ncbi:MAG: HEPN domain-containing protein [Deltaproteobacteria bacterium]|nr:HEPN domain-containing protein [Deltaproteobacteria bacterium]